jgi:hypothetical protein
MKAETCSCCVLLNILFNKVVLEYKFIHFYYFMLKLCSEDKMFIDFGMC